jgi:oligosaccharyl transferase complex subunit OST4
MITDDELYRLAVLLGSATMLLIVLYHFLEVNAAEEPAESEKSGPSSSLTDAKVGTIVR